MPAVVYEPPPLDRLDFTFRPYEPPPLDRLDFLFGSAEIATRICFHDEAIIQHFSVENESVTRHFNVSNESIREC